MENLEKELQSAASVLLSALRFGNLLTQVETELECLSVIANYSQRSYDKPQENQAFQSAKEDFEKALNKIRTVFGNDSVQALYTCFKKVVETPELMKSLYGVESLPEGMSFDQLFQSVFDRAKQDVSLAKEVDGAGYWNNLVVEVLNPESEKEEDTDATVICPICGSVATLQPSELYATGLQSPFVWGCKCGAYALADANNGIVGTLADSGLHQQRTAIRKTVSEACELEGLTQYEYLQMLSRALGRQIKKLSDIEFLNADECEACMNFYLKRRNARRHERVEYPTSQKELMRFFNEGGRARVLDGPNAEENGKLLIPVAVGPSSLVVRSKKGHEVFRFPTILEYQFRGNMFSIVHPSGSKTRFQMYAPLK